MLSPWNEQTMILSGRSRVLIQKIWDAIPVAVLRLGRIQAEFCPIRNAIVV
jgi:hypothetical protein